MINEYSVYDSVTHDTGRTRLSESEAEVEEPTNHKAGIKHCDGYILSVLLPTLTMYR